MKTTIKTKVEITATLELKESHLRALDAMIGYGDDAFLKAFYVRFYRHYMSPFEKDLRELFDSLREQLPDALRGVVEIREKLTKANLK